MNEFECMNFKWIKSTSIMSMQNNDTKQISKIALFKIIIAMQCSSNTLIVHCTLTYIGAILAEIAQI